MRETNFDGKSEPASTTQEILLESGAGENKRAPMAAKVPAPPKISDTGGLGGGY